MNLLKVRYGKYGRKNYKKPDITIIQTKKNYTIRRNIPDENSNEYEKF